MLKFLIKGKKKKVKDRINVIDVLFMILWFVCSLAVWVIYHKLFNVLYFTLFNSCMKEIIMASFLGAIVAVMIIRFWVVAIIIVMLFCVAFFKKY